MCDMKIKVQNTKGGKVQVEKKGGGEKGGRKKLAKLWNEERKNHIETHNFVR